MHAYLIIGKNKTELESKLDEILQSLKGKVQEFDLKKINDVRELGRFTRLRLSQKTTILIKDFDKASTEAQNAFLKNLEEPQKLLSYVLTAGGDQEILETIKSRCNIIELTSAVSSTKEQTKLAEDFIKKSKGEKLLILDKFKSREDALKLVEDLLVGSHHLVKDQKLNDYKILESLEKAHKALQANGNVKLQLATLAL